MARSKYIYHIRGARDRQLIASFTVKREAHEWMERWKLDIRGYQLTRVHDGVCDFKQKFEKKVDWDE